MRGQAGGAIMNVRDSVAAIYLVGQGSISQPRLIELQHQRILRYRSALAGRYELGRSAPRVFVDLALPRFAMGEIDFREVPEFSRLRDGVQNENSASFTSILRKTPDSRRDMNRNSGDL